VRRSPCIRGMRIRVKDVLELLAAGVSEKEILEDYPDLEAEDIKACLQHAAAQADHALLRVPRNSLSMLSYRLPWRGCCVKADMMLSLCVRSAFERPVTPKSGGMRFNSRQPSSRRIRTSLSVTSTAEISQWWAELKKGKFSHDRRRFSLGKAQRKL
jgi:uncharacterized protein (DUF433 family)